MLLASPALVVRVLSFSRFSCHIIYRHSSPPFLFIHSCCQTHPSTRAHLIPFIPLCAHLSLWRSRLYYTCPYHAPLAPSHRDSIQRNRWSCSVLWTSCIRHLERCSGNSSLGIETNEGCHNSNTFIGHMSQSCLGWTFFTETMVPHYLSFFSMPSLKSPLKCFSLASHTRSIAHIRN